MSPVGLFLECVQATQFPVCLRVTNPPGMPISRMAIPAPQMEIPTNSSWLVEAFTALMVNYPGWGLHRVGTVDREWVVTYHVWLVREDGFPPPPPPPPPQRLQPPPPPQYRAV